jgi:vacuolar-type H+-ATPase subunit H
MHEILKSILTAEEEVRLRVESSSKKAAEKRAKADIQAEAILLQAREQASSVIREQINTAKTEAAETYSKSKAVMLLRQKTKLASLDRGLNALAERLAKVVLTSLVE